MIGQERGRQHYCLRFWSSELDPAPRDPQLKYWAVPPFLFSSTDEGFFEEGEFGSFISLSNFTTRLTVPLGYTVEYV